MDHLHQRPAPGEYLEYYGKYIALVPTGDISVILRDQLEDTRAVLRSVPPGAGDSAYAAGKWTIKEVVSHINDTERMFTFRALWFARGLPSPLPSFDQDVALAGAHADERPWREHIDEFRVVRAASLALFEPLTDDAWSKRGTASGNPVSVRALAYITAGHVTHHALLLKERYL